MVAISKQTDLNNNLAELKLGKSSENVDALFAELFSLVNLSGSEVLDESDEGIKNLEKSNNNPNLPMDDEKSLELAKSLAEIFYKELGIKKEKDFTPQTNHKSNSDEDFGKELISAIPNIKSNIGVEEKKSFDSNNFAKSEIKELKNQILKPLKNLSQLTNKSSGKNQEMINKDSNQNDYEGNENKEKIIISVKSIKNKTKVNKDHGSISELNSGNKKKDNQDNLIKNTKKVSFEEKPNVVLKKNEIKLTEKKIEKKNKQTETKIEKSENETIPKNNLDKEIKGVLQPSFRKNDDSKKEITSNIKKIDSEKNVTTEKREIHSDSKFHSQETLDLMESSWGEKFAKILKTSIKNGSNQVNLKLNPKNLGKLKVEIVVKDGSTQINIDAENTDAANILNDNLSKLNEMIDEKNTKFSSFSGQNNESFLKQKNQSRQEKVEQILEKKKELNVSKSKNKNLHNIDVQA